MTMRRPKVFSMWKTQPAQRPAPQENGRAAKMLTRLLSLPADRTHASCQAAHSSLQQWGTTGLWPTSYE